MLCDCIALEFGGICLLRARQPTTTDVVFIRCLFGIRSVDRCAKRSLTSNI